MTEKKCNSDQLEVGEFVSRTSYLKILSHKGSSIEVLNPQDVQWHINGKDIIESEIYSSQQFSEVVNLPMTKLAQAFIEEPGDAVFTANFIKINGEERTLVGYRLNNLENNLGRSNVWDLEKKGQRQIDHRTLHWFITKNVKYQLKK